MSIRLRLTLLYTALVVVVLVGFSTALYAGQARHTRRVAEAGLRAAAFRLVDRHPGDPSDLAMHPFAERVRPPVAYFQARTLQGELVGRSPGLGNAELPLSPDGLEAAERGETSIDVVRLGDERLMVLNTPVRAGGRVAGVVQTASSLTQLDNYLRGLRNSLVLVSVLTAAVAFGGGWFLAGEALRPIDRITRTAGEIGAGRDFARRVDHRGPNDEVGQLAQTFNEMLAELQAAYQAVEAALRQQRQFVADASHELRTPLTTVRGNAELLRLEPPIEASDRDAALNDIVTETERLMALVGDLLTLARADAGRRLASEPIRLRALFEELVRQARVLDPDRLVGAEVEGEPLALGDPDALRQVLRNLLSNAMHHTPPTASIKLSAVEADGLVEVSVSDTGPGIDPELLPSVFERFQRGHPARTGPGSGLGLAIAKALAEAQGGAISVSSVPGEGATFTLRLPSARGEPRER